VQTVYIKWANPTDRLPDSYYYIIYLATDYFQNSMNDSFTSLNKLFNVSKLVFSFDKTNVFKFCAKSKMLLIYNSPRYVFME
jgi:hypothetical protein